MDAFGAVPERRWRIRGGSQWLTGTDTGAGEPVVLLHGLASTHRWWDLVAQRLPRFRVVRFDHRGHGGSSVPVDGYDLDTLVADTLDVLDQLNLGPAVLAGHSLGAAVALRIAAAHPDRVAALACVDGGLYDPPSLFGAVWEQARAQMLRPRRGRITPAVLRAWLASTDLPAAALPAILANYDATGPDGTLRLRLAPRHEEQLAHDLWRQDPLPFLQAVRAPVLALAAHQGDPRQDLPRRESIQRARTLLGTLLTVDWVPGGHELPLEHPDQVANALTALSCHAPDPA